MTLYRQLLLSTLLILLCLCTGLWIGEIKRTRDFLVNQMGTHAQDTATSLGLTLTTIAKGANIAEMKTIINALFDRGYYRIIEFRNIDGKILIERRTDLLQDEVPAWFIRLVPLSAPQATALVMHGWQQAGAVSVESHPGHAYQALWQAAQATALWFTLTGAIIALLGGLGLRLLLRPLRRIEEQAMALCDRQFYIQEQLPRTRELRRVVIAMNRMTDRIREMFHEQVAIADTLRQLTYQDPLTATGNRRYLEAQIKAKLEGRDTAVKGFFLLFQIQDLLAINQAYGYQEGDRIIKETASIIQQACHELPESILGRMGGGDFALLLPNTDEQTTRRITDAILEDLCQRVATETSSATNAGVYSGGVFYEQAASFGQLLTRADTALSTARYNCDHKKIEILPLVDEEEKIWAGKTEWKELLDNIIANRSIILYSQSTVSLHDLNKTLHHEILTRVIDATGRHLPMGMFIPMAERLGLMPALDKMIIEKLLEQSVQQFYPHRIAINLSPLSLIDNDFVTWIHQQLEQCAQVGIQLNFEFPEFRMIRYGSLIREFSEVIKNQGHIVGVDHFGQGLMHFGYLKSLLPNYVKIDRAITSELLNEQSDRSFFINALCNVAHSLDIKVIVEAVENENQWHVLSKMPLDGAQGFYIQQPQPITTLDD
ncbi:MAG: EAL domain-containing protein [Desulfobulbaceae bacterium]|nr:EAL domain-containing protein [Desulfobulbaceae bacterium]